MKTIPQKRGKSPNDEKVARTGNIIKELSFKTTKDPTIVYCKSDTFF